MYTSCAEWASQVFPVEKFSGLIKNKNLKVRRNFILGKFIWKWICVSKSYVTYGMCLQTWSSSSVELFIESSGEVLSLSLPQLIHSKGETNFFLSKHNLDPGFGLRNLPSLPKVPSLAWRTHRWAFQVSPSRGWYGHRLKPLKYRDFQPTGYDSYDM